MKSLTVSNLAKIKQANIFFGDLNLFVGSQATGKSILLELIKLLLDSKPISRNLELNGYSWKNELEFFELYFGGGTGGVWSKKTKIILDKKEISYNDLFNKNNSVLEKVFYIPAQRVLTLSSGWIRPFDSFELGDPYVLRDFSEKLRFFMQENFGKKRNIFPRSNTFNTKISQAINAGIFYGAKVELNTIDMRKQIQIDLEGNKIPFTAWSTGQREFMPLLLGLYCLLPENQSSKLAKINWIVLEEPEMGLHPQAILSVIFICLELIHRGYKILVSTHSPVILEAIWAIRFIQSENRDTKYLDRLFQIEPYSTTTTIFKNILQNKTFLTYYFDRQDDDVIVKDISSLDPFSEDLAVANWGGLTSFSSRASEVVSDAAQEKA